MPKVDHQPSDAEIAVWLACMHSELLVAQGLPVPALSPRFPAGCPLLNNISIVPLINGGPHDQPCWNITDHGQLPRPNVAGDRWYTAASWDGVTRGHRMNFVALLSGFSTHVPGGGMAGGVGCRRHRVRVHMTGFRRNSQCQQCHGSVHPPAALTCSHMCGNAHCCNPEHIALEIMGHHSCKPTIGPLEAHRALTPFLGSTRARHQKAMVALHPHTRVAGGPGLAVAVGALFRNQGVSGAHGVPLPRIRRFITPMIPLAYLGAPAPGPIGTHHQVQTDDRLSVLEPHRGEARDGFLETRSSKRHRTGHSMCPSI